MNFHLILRPDEHLRTVSSDVMHFDEMLSAIVENMIDIMYTNNGIGIAAPQVGIDRKIIIVDPSAGEDATKMMVLINPKIIQASGDQLSVEGCLSIPNTIGKVHRFAEIEVNFQDVTGAHHSIKTNGLLSTILQHEIDHLCGVLFTDRAYEISLPRKIA